MRLDEFIATQAHHDDGYHGCSVCRLLGQLTDADREDFAGGVAHNIKATLLHRWLTSRAQEEGLWCPKIGVVQRHVRENHQAAR